ncbi:MULTISPECIES: hypothetical protein [Exiguobacterium]|uniref:hypothetical protein n=1 Tax=Exiguobacterium TaxID=33986 RepID=UPI001BECDC37|nr:MULTISPECIES: hypothetical protein [Exiguobacterium]MCT4783982.1 hypothetical protein [Exiguobacterium himgiriensis]
MRRFVSVYGGVLIAVLLLVGCDDAQRVVNGTEPADDEAIAVAWSYITARNWQGTSDEGQNAEVNRIVIKDGFELFDETLIGEEVLAVSFVSEPDSVVGAPIVLLSPKTNEVIGYIPSE